MGNGNGRMLMVAVGFAIHKLLDLAVLIANLYRGRSAGSSGSASGYVPLVRKKFDRRNSVRNRPSKSSYVSAVTVGGAITGIVVAVGVVITSIAWVLLILALMALEE